jgi:hypothetical protein
MAGVGLLNDDVLAVCCQGFVGSDTSGKVSVNFCITQFDTTCSDLAGIRILVDGLRFNAACFFTCFSGTTGTIFFKLMCWCDGSIEEV